MRGYGHNTKQAAKRSASEGKKLGNMQPNKKNNTRKEWGQKLTCILRSLYSAQNCDSIIFSRFNSSESWNAVKIGSVLETIQLNVIGTSKFFTLDQIFLILKEFLSFHWHVSTFKETTEHTFVLTY